MFDSVFNQKFKIFYKYTAQTEQFLPSYTIFVK